MNHFFDARAEIRGKKQSFLGEIEGNKKYLGFVRNLALLNCLPNYLISEGIGLFFENNDKPTKIGHNSSSLMHEKL